jgi:pimeloyl-ACP methyl ester carboxylesterase
MEKEISSIERGLVSTSAGYIHYRSVRNGHQPLMLFHINQQSSALMIELIDALAASFSPVAIDYPSYGMSDHIKKQPSVKDYARWAIEVMDALGIEKAIVLGEASGAIVSIEMAAAFPQRVTKAVLVNCPFSPDPTRLEKHLAEMKAGPRPHDTTGFPCTRTIEFVLNHDPMHSPMCPDQSWMDRINVAQIETGRERYQALTAISKYDTAAGLKQISCPTLLLAGEHFYYAEFSSEIAKYVADLEYDVLKGARFCATWEFAVEIAQRVLEFSSRR